MNLDNYEDVQARITRWYGDNPNARISTRLEHIYTDDHGGLVSCVVSASVYRDAEDANPAGTGLAQEHRTDRGVNVAFALENCETSAIGRAIVNAGLPPAGGSRPSRQEMEKAAQVKARPQKTTSEPVPLSAGPGDEGVAAVPEAATPAPPTMGEAIGNVLDAMPGSRIESQDATPSGRRGHPTPATDKQKAMIRRLCANLSLEGDLAREYVAHVLGEPVTFDALTKMQASDLITALLEDEAKQADPANNPAITEDPWAGEQGAF